MIRVETDEAAGGGAGLLPILDLVVRVDQFQLRLLGIAPEREAGIESFQLGDGSAVTTGIEGALGILVQILLLQVGCRLVAGTASEQGACHNRAARAEHRAENRIIILVSTIPWRAC